MQGFVEGKFSALTHMHWIVSLEMSPQICFLNSVPQEVCAHSSLGTVGAQAPPWLLWNHASKLSEAQTWPVSCFTERLFLGVLNFLRNWSRRWNVTTELAWVWDVLQKRQDVLAALTLPRQSLHQLPPCTYEPIRFFPSGFGAGLDMEVWQDEEKTIGTLYCAFPTTTAYE